MEGSGFGKYGTITASDKKFHEGEPIFLIRSTDPLASQGVLDYARRAEKAGADPEFVESCFDFAMTVAEWQRNNPELVKALPD